MQHNQQSQDALAQAKALAHKASSAWRYLQNQGTGPIGLDFNQSGINAVQLTRKGDVLRIKAAASIPYPAELQQLVTDPALLKKTIERLLKSGQFKGNETVVSAPMGEPKVLSLSFKSQTPQDIPRHVIELVTERLGGADNEWLVDYLPVTLSTKSTQEVTVMAAAMQRHKALNFMEQLQQADLHLHAVEIAPQALQRLLSLLPEQHANCLVINVGQHSSYLSHFLNGRLTMDREIAIGYHDFVAPIGTALKLEPSVASNLFYTLGFGEHSEISPLVSQTFAKLKAQIDLMNQYIASQLHGSRMDCIYLTGEAANWPSANAAFSRALGCNTLTLNAFDLLEREQDLTAPIKHQANLSVAAGLAMRWPA